jgi:hypothetical protein
VGKDQKKVIYFSKKKEIRKVFSGEQAAKINFGNNVLVTQIKI